MRLNISLKFPHAEWFPIHYHYLLQSAIYHVMEGDIADQVHAQGFEGSGRIFRLFTFSKLLGRYELSKDKKSIRFPEGAKWIVSSPLNSILESIAGGMLKQPTLRIGGTNADITGIQISDPKVHYESIRVRTLSPVVAYSTMFRGDGSKYTMYVQPGEPEFRRIIAGNLQKKLEGVRTWNQTAEKEERSLPSDQEVNHLGAKKGDVQIHVLNTPRLHILEYKGGIIKGYSAMMELTGPIPLLQVALDAGFGSKNAQGFGCLEVMGKG